MQRGTDHGTGNAQALGAVAFHLGTEHQFRARLRHGLLHGEVVVGDQRFQAQLLGRCTHLPGQLTAVAPQAHHLEPQFLAGDAGRRNGMGGITKDEYPLAGEVGGIHRTRVPGQPRWLPIHWRFDAQQAAHLLHKGPGGANADRHRSHGGHAKTALQPAAHRPG